MSNAEFLYWLAGFFEGKPSLSAEEQIQEIKNHLSLAMTKVTPPIVVPNKVRDKDRSDLLECSNETRQLIMDFRQDCQRINGSGKLC